MVNFRSGQIFEAANISKIFGSRFAQPQLIFFGKNGGGGRKNFSYLKFISIRVETLTLSKF